MTDDTKVRKSIFARYETSKDAEEDGIWKDFGEGFRVRIRRFNSDKSREARKKAERLYTDKIARKVLTDDEAETILNEHIAYGIIADWEGFVTEDGQGELTFTPSAALAVFPRIPDFRNEVLGISMDRDGFNKAAIEEALGNSNAA